MSDSFDSAKFMDSIKEQVNQNLEGYAATLQAALDRAAEGMSGQSMEEIRPKLQSAWRNSSNGGELSDEHLDAFAKAVSEGRRIELNDTHFRV